MWNKYVWAILGGLVLMASGCKSKQKLTEAVEVAPLATPNLAAQTFLETANQSAPNWETLHLRANGNAVMSGSSQRFKVDIRMERGTKIWIDLSEPNLGLKVARALITPDSVAYYSNLLKKADAGSFEKLTQLLGADLNFHMLQQALIGGVALQPERDLQVKTEGNVQLLFGQPSAQFKGFNGQTVTIALELDGAQKRLVRQELIAGKDRIAAIYQGTSLVGGQIFPAAVNLQTFGRQNIEMNLQYTEIQLNTEIKTPFNYPQNYEPLRF